MSRYQVRASSGVGAVGGTSSYRVKEALHVAHGYRDRGFRNITLVSTESGVETELDRFQPPSSNFG